MKRSVWRLSAVFGIVAASLVIGLSFRRPTIYNIKVRTYFRNAAGLRDGAAVRVDGVELGSVTTVRVRPELGAYPVEAFIVIDAPYRLTIPNDSPAILGSEGILGPPVIDIDTRMASGPPIGKDGILKSMEPLGGKDCGLFEAIGKALTDASRKPKDKQTAPNLPAAQ